MPFSSIVAFCYSHWHGDVTPSCALGCTLHQGLIYALFIAFSFIARDIEVNKCSFGRQTMPPFVNHRDPRKHPIHEGVTTGNDAYFPYLSCNDFIFA